MRQGILQEVTSDMDVDSERELEANSMHQPGGVREDVPVEQ